ncbi:MAG: hypothetical protein AAGI07_18090 [Bacteroidota bacterium]
MNNFLLIIGFITIFQLNAKAQQLSPKWDFQGKYLIAISDADMLPSAYENGKLGPLNGADQLAVVPLNTAPQNYKAFTAEVSNSVAGPPSVVDVTPDGNYAFVIETFSPRPGKSDQETFADFKLGNKLTIIDLTNPEAPKNIETIEIPDRPLSVNINKDGSLLAISYHPQGGGTKQPISIHKIVSGKVTKNYFPKISGWSLTDELIDVVWHPQQNIIALINSTKATVSFMEFSENDDDIALKVWGNTVSVGKQTFIGRFTEDGKHFLVNNLYWGSDVANTWTEAPRGTIVNITLNHFEANGQPVHSLTSQVMVGASPEGFAVSPDGKYVAVVNMERSWLPYDDKRQTWFSSISLIKRNPETGAMTHVSTTPYYAILPEMAVFDATSKYLAVVSSDQYDHTLKGGALDFFQIVKDPLDTNRETLVQTRYTIPLQHGAHDLILVK